MFFFVIGLPGRFTDWCTALTARLGQQALGTSEVVEANTLEEVARDLIARRTTQGVIVSTGPGGRLLGALTETNHRFIVAWDDPRRAMTDLVLGQGMAPPTALRRVASSCAALSSVQSMAGALNLFAERDARKLQDTALAISRHLNLPLEDTDLDALLSDIASPLTLGEATDPAAMWWSLGADVREIAENALRGYFGDAGANEASVISWAPELFTIAGHPDQALDGPVEITGRARCLIEGPHIHIMPGVWTLALTLSFSPEAAEHELMIEIAGCEPGQQHLIRADASHRFEGATEVLISERAEYPICIRISSLRAAFDGTVTLTGARLTRHSIKKTEPADGGS